MISSEDDLVYDRAAKVVTEEFKHIRQWRGLAEDPKVGLALSGGGIRSASFCLGVLQALAHDGKLKNIDYLSTVSGGGYIGASLTYLLHVKTREILWPLFEQGG
ncbi:MAG TPA: patatin-like phospholipase family protein [Burkholderiaceae bacterium]|nr:patatin-like phospholipase family protein [Burkholderiaceae bacterium]HNB43472.1 patatin-like phospholipase family protein [Burkholderiaceae bacterium]HNG78413.1 patatin-like phospholipase family protein [Burkholderiaceae bacterium]